MLCDESLELEYGNFTEGAKLIRMKDWNDIKLSDIWIPCELLPNRQVTKDPNVGYCSIYHTLTKPQLLSNSSFSTYSDQSPNAVDSNFNHEEWLDSLEEVTLCAEQRKYQCSTAEESNENCIDREINKSPLDSTTYLLEDLCIQDTENSNFLQEVEDCVVDVGNKEISNDKSMEDLYDNSIAFSEQLNVNYTENMNPTFNSKFLVTNNSEIISNSPSKLVNNSASNDYVSNCGGKLLQVNSESAYYLPQTSDNDLFSKDSLESCPSVIKNSQCNGFWNFSKSSTELSGSQVKSMCPNVNTHDNPHTKDASVPEMHNVNAEFKVPISVIDEIKLECNDVVAKLLSLPEKYSGGTHYYDNNLMNNTNDYVWEESTEKMMEAYVDNTVDIDDANNTDVLSFSNLQVYQHVKEDLTTDPKSAIKKKARKEKKMKQKNKNMPLEDFFLSPTEAMYMEPEVDEFYESIIRKRDGNDSDIQLRKTAFPPLPRKQEITFEPCDKYEKNQLNLNAPDSLIEESSKPEFNNFEKPPVKIEESIIDENIIIIENIPLGVDEETLRNLLVIYGTIKCLNIKQSKKSFTAELSIDVEDPDWIIDSLNGSQPFGASSEVLKCYQRS